MSKPVKKKAKPVAKKKKRVIRKAVDAKEQARAEREIKRGLADLDERTDERYDYAKLILDGQSRQVRGVVEEMLIAMKKMAGEPTVFYKGAPINVENGVAATLQEKTFYWIAARLLVTLATWDIRLDDFELPKKLCARCGEKP